jgi:hypothetical protein
LTNKEIKISLKELNSYRTWTNTTSIKEFFQIAKKREKAKTTSEICHILLCALKDKSDQASFRIHTTKELILLQKQRYHDPTANNIQKSDIGKSN